MKAPDYTTIAWRIAKINIKIDPSFKEVDDIVIAVDASGIKVADRGEWIVRDGMLEGA